MIDENIEIGSKKFLFIYKSKYTKKKTEKKTLNYISSFDSLLTVITPAK